MHSFSLLQSKKRHEHDFPIVDDSEIISQFQLSRTVFTSYLTNITSFAPANAQDFPIIDDTTSMILENRFATHNDFCSKRIDGYAQLSMFAQINVAIQCAYKLVKHSRTSKDLNSLNSVIRMLDWLQQTTMQIQANTLNETQISLLLETLELETASLRENGLVD